MRTAVAPVKMPQSTGLTGKTPLSNPRNVLFALCSGLVFVFSSCEKTLQKEDFTMVEDSRFRSPGKGIGNVSPDMVIKWNDAAIQSVRQTQAIVSDPPISPFVESRFYAMVNVAMHDALNSIVPKYATYALKNSRDKDADPNAAVAQAAHDVISALFGTLNPPAFVTPQPVRDAIAQLLESSLSQVTNDDARARGIALGKAAAAAILAKRNGDGVQQVMYPVTEGTAPGEYRFTFPFNGPPFNTPPFSGLYDAPGWGQVTPFGLETGAQFRPCPPDHVSSAAYAADFNEVKRLGRFNSTERTSEQTTIAKFWAESSPQGWNRIAVTVICDKRFNAWKAARLLALMQMAEADAYIGSLEAKIFYFYWRPVTAIRLADTDGNPATEADPNWDVLGWNPAGPPDFRFWPTPPIADYPSAHSVAGGAGAEVLRQVIGTDRFSFAQTSTTDPATRHFDRFSAAARENALSRIYIGFHFRKACLEGEAQGKKIGAWVASRALRER